MGRWACPFQKEGTGCKPIKYFLQRRGGARKPIINLIGAQPELEITILRQSYNLIGAA